MSEDQSESISRLLSYLEAERVRRDAELEKLATSLTTFQVMTQFADEFEGILNYLFNYSHAVWGNGEGQTDMQEVYDRIVDDLRKVFQKMTGKPYVPAIVRSYRIVTEERNRRDKKFLDAIMHPVSEGAGEEQ